MKRISFVADFILLLVAVIWGSTFVIVQNAISFIEPLTFNAIRFFIAGLFLMIWILCFHRNEFKLEKKLVLSGIFIGIWLFGGYALQTFGLLYTTSSKAGFITGLSVVLVPLFSLILLKQRLSFNGIIGAIVATIGLYILTMGDSFTLNIGDALVFFCAISFALHIIYIGKYTSLYSALMLTIIQIFTVALLCTISAFFFEDWQTTFQNSIILKKQVLIALFITSLFATALAFLAQTAFQKFTSPTKVALIFATEPVFAAITAYFGANERLSTIALWGCLAIFIGMIIAEWPSKKLVTSTTMVEDNENVY